MVPTEWLDLAKHPVSGKKEFKPVSLSLKNLNPVQLLVVGYFLVTLTVSCLLMLPLASAKNETQPFIDALFVASSGISTTGLTPVDIGTYYSLFGQIVLLVDFQVGGLGYMAIVVWLAGLLHKRLSIKSHLIAKESLAGTIWLSSGHFFRKVVAFTVFFELSGGLFLAAYWTKYVSLPRAIYWSIFHSISAFCTAGFGLFSDSLARFQNSIFVNLTITLLSLCGAIGFFALADFVLLAKSKMGVRRRTQLSTHTKLAALVTLAAISAGAITIFFLEKWPAETTSFQKVMSSSFQAISASTTDGFSTMNIGAMTSSSLVLILLLMIVGASPGSTGGGIKTTTFGIIFCAAKSQLTNRSDCNVFKRRIPDEVVRKSFSVFFLFFMVMIIDILIMCRTEQVPFLSLIFETGSALGNTGLSTGIMSSLSWLGKLLLSLTMFIGRVGPLTIGLALAGKKKDARFCYADGDVFVG